MFQLQYQAAIIRCQVAPLIRLAASLSRRSGAQAKSDMTAIRNFARPMTHRHRHRQTHTAVESEGTGYSAAEMTPAMAAAGASFLPPPTNVIYELQELASYHSIYDHS